MTSVMQIILHVCILRMTYFFFAENCGEIFINFLIDLNFLLMGLPE
jgi:hypothetical protein